MDIELVKNILWIDCLSMLQISIRSTSILSENQHPLPDLGRSSNYKWWHMYIYIYIIYIYTYSIIFIYSIATWFTSPIAEVIPMVRTIKKSPQPPRTHFCIAINISHWLKRYYRYIHHYPPQFLLLPCQATQSCPVGIARRPSAGSTRRGPTWPGSHWIFKTWQWKMSHLYSWFSRLNTPSSEMS